MYLILMGPPGAGKGTQAERLSKEFLIPHISTGDIFRKAIKEETELGRRLKEYLDSGALVPDDITIGIVKERIQNKDCEKGFMLDGFPRTVSQARALDESMKELKKELDRVIYISVSEETLVERLTGRKGCKKCGTVYHISFNPSKNNSKCDLCDGELYQRSDDTLETVKNRFKVYLDNTRPLIEYYSQKGILEEVDGNKSVKEVYKNIKKIVGEARYDHS